MTTTCRVRDVHRLADAMPESVRGGTAERPSWAVRGKSFVFFREPRPDAVDDQGNRLTDVICLRTQGQEAKAVLVDDDNNPFFTTPHFNGYPAVLVRESQLDRCDLALLEEVISDAWLSLAPKKLARQYLDSLERASTNSSSPTET